MSCLFEVTCPQEIQKIKTETERDILINSMIFHYYKTDHFKYNIENSNPVSSSKGKRESTWISFDHIKINGQTLTSSINHVINHNSYFSLHISYQVHHLQDEIQGGQRTSEMLQFRIRRTNTVQQNETICSVLKKNIRDGLRNLSGTKTANRSSYKMPGRSGIWEYYYTI